MRARLELTFRRYGLPDAFFVDNGAPWGDAQGTRWTRLGVWLLKLGVDVVHSRPYHPQSRGKNERFHRTLKAEVFALQQFRTSTRCSMPSIAGALIYNPASQHPSVYVVEGKRVCCPGQGPLGCHARFRARSAIVCADGASRSERLKIHGPSANGWTASISPPSAASRSVFWLIPRSLAARVRFSQGSTPSAAGRQTGMRW